MFYPFIFLLSSQPIHLEISLMCLFVSHNEVDTSAKNIFPLQIEK